MSTTARDVYLIPGLLLCFGLFGPTLFVCLGRQDYRMLTLSHTPRLRFPTHLFPGTRQISQR